MCSLTDSSLLITWIISAYLEKAGCKVYEDWIIYLLEIVKL